MNGRITTETLGEHADALAGAYLAMNEAGHQVISDDLWSRIKERWTVLELEETLRAHLERGDLTAFLALVADLRN